LITGIILNLSILGLVPSALGDTKTIAPEEIVKKADEARAPQGDFSCLVEVQDKDGDTVSAKTTYKVYSKGNDLTLVQTVAPARLVGRKLLMRENDLWLYLPSVKRPTRVGFQQRLTGEVSNGDLASTNFAKDYDAKIVGDDTLDGHACYKLELTAKRKDVTYNSITYWVEKNNFHPRKAEFHALSGKLLKTGIYSRYAPELGKERVSQMIITDALHPTRQSVLQYKEYRREKLNDRLFNKESLAE
jgi:hypothetical protein